jgi:hypothetical protein
VEIRAYSSYASFECETIWTPVAILVPEGARLITDSWHRITERAKFALRPGILALINCFAFEEKLWLASSLRNDFMRDKGERRERRAIEICTETSSESLGPAI